MLALNLVFWLMMGGAPIDTTLALAFQPQVGQTHLFEVTKTREEHAPAPRPAERVEQVWLLESEVRSRRPGGYAMAWTYRRDGPEARPAFEPVTGTLANVEIVFAVDHTGQPQRLLNPHFVRSSLAEAIAAVRPAVAGAERARLDAQLEQARTDEGLLALVLADVARLHLPLGRSLVLGAEVSLPASLTNPFGERPIPAIETVRLDSLSSATGQVYVSWTLAPDPVVLAGIVLDLLEAFAPGAVAATPEALAARFVVGERGRFEVDPLLGLVRRAEFERRVQMDQHRRVESVQFRLLAAGAGEH